MMATKKYVLLLLMSLTLLSACKKEKLSTEYGDIYGTWVWTHTYKNEYDPVIFEEITPSSTGDVYKIKIEEKYMYFYKNNKKLFKRHYKQIKYYPDVAGSSIIGIGIVFNRKESTGIDYDPVNQKMGFARFPYHYAVTGNMDDPIQGGDTFNNYFIKE